MRRLAILAVAACLAQAPAVAVEPDEVLPDPALEARARELSKGLRCLVCRNESIDESSAGIARDLRLLVRERLVAGDDDAAVIDYVVDRYGEYVLLNPTTRGANLVLWGAPVVLLLVGGAVALVHIRGQRHASPAAALTTDEETRLARLMDAPDDR